MASVNRKLYHVQKLKQIENCFLEHDSKLSVASTVTSSESSRAPLEHGGKGDSHQGCVDKSTVTLGCYYVNVGQKLWRMFLAPC